MSQQQYQHQQQQQQQRQSKPTNGGPRRCPHCGTVYEPGDAFCSECGARLDGGVQVKQEMQVEQHVGGRQCPHCHKAIHSATAELCPHCGLPLNDTYCLFCGTPFEGSEPFCSECGSPRGGIKCPQCGTLAFRSFCPNCNAPLNDNAMAALRLAQSDPHFQRARQLQQEMAEMEEYLQEFAAEIEKAIAEAEMEDDGPDAPGLSAEGEQLQAKYAEIMKLLGQRQVTPPPAQKPAGPKPSVKKREQLKLKFVDANKIMAAYQQKAAEMEAELKTMIPDPGMTPQQQRDFVSARKICVDTRVTKVVPQYWECNYCHCWHRQPSECCEPQLGGTWHYETITVGERVWKYMD